MNGRIAPFAGRYFLATQDVNCSNSHSCGPWRPEIVPNGRIGVCPESRYFAVRMDHPPDRPPLVHVPLTIDCAAALNSSVNRAFVFSSTVEVQVPE